MIIIDDHLLLKGFRSFGALSDPSPVVSGYCYGVTWLQIAGALFWLCLMDGHVCVCVGTIDVLFVMEPTVTWIAKSESHLSLGVT